MGGRLCALLCGKRTYRNLPLCPECYKKYKDIIDDAIKNNAEWFRELQNNARREVYAREKMAKMLGLEVIGVENYDREVL